MTEKDLNLTPEREPTKKEVTVGEIITICEEILGEGSCEEMQDMDLEEALGYATTLLEEAGINAEEFFKKKGIEL